MCTSELTDQEPPAGLWEAFDSDHESDKAVQDGHHANH